MLIQKLLQRRSNQVYYFRWVCPAKVRQIVGRRELIKSLHTREPYVASSRAASYYAAVLQIVSILNMNDLTDEEIETAVQRRWDKIGSSQKLACSEQDLERVVRAAWVELDSRLNRPFSEEELSQFSNFGVDDYLDYWSQEIEGLNGQFDRVTGKFHCSPNDIEEVLAKYKIDHMDYRRDDCERLYQELKRIETD